MFRVFFGGIILTTQTARVKIGSVTDMGTVTAITRTGVKLTYNGQVFEASFGMMERLVQEGKVV